MRDINIANFSRPIAPSIRAAIGRIRNQLEMPTEKISIWEFVDPTREYDAYYDIVTADAYAAARGAALYVPAVPTSLGARKLITTTKPVTFTAAGGFGDLFNYETGPMFAFTPTIATADLTAGFKVTNGHWHHLNFHVTAPNGPFGNDVMRPQDVLTAGYFSAWGANGLTSAMDPATFFQNSAVQLLPGVGFAPGWIALEIGGACTVSWINAQGGKIGIKNNSQQGHANIFNTTAVGWMLGEWYAINGQDYLEFNGGRQGCIAAIAVGNTNLSGVRGGFIGAMERLHLIGSGFGVLQVQDDPTTTLPAGGSSGFQGLISNCSTEVIGSQNFHLWTPKDGTTKGSDFATEFLNFNAGGADTEDPRFNLPVAVETAMGITHGQYFGGELGSINNIKTNRDFGAILITDAGKDLTCKPDFGNIQSVTMTIQKNGLVPTNYSNGSPAKRGELFDSADYLDTGNLSANPELKVVDVSGLLSNAAEFHTAKGGNWSYDQTNIQAAVMTLSGWQAKVDANSLHTDLLVASEGISKHIHANHLVFKFVNTNATTSYQIVVSNSGVKVGGHKGMSFQVISSDFVTYDLNDSAGSGMLQAVLRMPNGTGKSGLILKPYFVENMVIPAGRGFGRWICTIQPGATVYIACPMVNYGKPARYNPNATPGYASGFLPTQATAAPAQLTRGGTWIDTSAGNVVKVVV